MSTVLYSIQSTAFQSFLISSFLHHPFQYGNIQLLPVTYLIICKCILFWIPVDILIGFVYFWEYVKHYYSSNRAIKNVYSEKYHCLHMPTILFPSLPLLLAPLSYQSLEILLYPFYITFVQRNQFTFIFYYISFLLHKCLPHYFVLSRCFIFKSFIFHCFYCLTLD